MSAEIASRNCPPVTGSNHNYRVRIAGAVMVVASAVGFSACGSAKPESHAHVTSAQEIAAKACNNPITYTVEDYQGLGPQSILPPIGQYNKSTGQYEFVTSGSASPVEEAKKALAEDLPSDILAEAILEAATLERETGVTDQTIINDANKVANQLTTNKSARKIVCEAEINAVLNGSNINDWQSPTGIVAHPIIAESNTKDVELGLESAVNDQDIPLLQLEPSQTSADYGLNKQIDDSFGIKPNGELVIESDLIGKYIPGTGRVQHEKSKTTHHAESSKSKKTTHHAVGVKKSLGTIINKLKNNNEGGTTPTTNGEGGTTPTTNGEGGTTPTTNGEGGTTPTTNGEGGTTPTTIGEGGTTPTTIGEGGTTTTTAPAPTTTIESTTTTAPAPTTTIESTTTTAPQPVKNTTPCNSAISQCPTVVGLASSGEGNNSGKIVLEVMFGGAVIALMTVGANGLRKKTINGSHNKENQ